MTSKVDVPLSPNNKSTTHIEPIFPEWQMKILGMDIVYILSSISLEHKLWVLQSLYNKKLSDLVVIIPIFGKWEYTFPCRE